MRIPGMRRTFPPLDAQASANPQFDRGPPDQSRTEMEARINKAVNAAEAADMARRTTGWRTWAVEQVLASPASSELLSTGWIVSEPPITSAAAVEPGGFLRIEHAAPVKMQRIPAPLYQIADDIVQYVLTGKHPTPATPEDPTHDDEAPPSPDADAGRAEQQPASR